MVTTLHDHCMPLTAGVGAHRGGFAAWDSFDAPPISAHLHRDPLPPLGGSDPPPPPASAGGANRTPKSDHEGPTLTQPYGSTATFSEDDFGPPLSCFILRG